MDSVARLGEPAPDFSLLDLDGVPHTLSSARGRILVLNFWSADCEWSRRSDPGVLAAVGAEGASAILWAVASNLGENLESLRKGAAEASLPVVLVDGDQAVAGAFAAAATPHIFVVDAQGILRYSGAPDDMTFRRQAQQHFLRDALAALRAGNAPAVEHSLARGCAIVRGGRYVTDFTKR